MPKDDEIDPCIEVILFIKNERGIHIFWATTNFHRNEKHVWKKNSANTEKN